MVVWSSARPSAVTVSMYFSSADVDDDIFLAQTRATIWKFRFDENYFTVKPYHSFPTYAFPLDFFSPKKGRSLNEPCKFSLCLNYEKLPFDLSQCENKCERGLIQLPHWYVLSTVSHGCFRQTDREKGKSPVIFGEKKECDGDNFCPLPLPDASLVRVANIAARDISKFAA